MPRGVCYFLYIALILILASFSSTVHALENGLARKPPMGWMSYERFRCVTDCKKLPSDCISESLFKRTADHLVSEGYADLGYKYLIIDDCWMESKRHPITGKLQANKERFPSGLNWLSDYIHNKGLKFGLYHDIGTRTCMNTGPGVNGHYALDAQTFADWNVDYVKVDGCYTKNINLNKAYPAFGQALNKTGRPMVYSCPWPFYQQNPNYELIKSHCNLWRFAEDIYSSYDSVINTMKNYDYHAKLQKLAGPGHWNDPDMLVLGNYYLSYEASQLQMAIWAIMAAPLIMSNDLATVRPEIKAILQNRDIIEVNQDRLGIAGKRILTKNNIQIWARPISPINNLGFYSQALAFVLEEPLKYCPLCPVTFTVTLKELGLLNIMGYTVYDLFNQSHNLGLFKENDSFLTRISPEGVTFYKFKPVDIY